MTTVSTSRQLDVFLARYNPAIEKFARDVRTRLKKQLPTAVEMVFDNYNALVLGYAAVDKSTACVISIALYPRWVTLFFLFGAKLNDPHHLLTGGGKQVRQIRLLSPEQIDAPEVADLIAQAVATSPIPFPAPKSVTVIKTVVAKPRPRRSSTEGT
jgi:hypothetical protein